MFTYSATQWIFGDEPLERTLARLRDAGYEGIELTGEPDRLHVPELKRLLGVYGLGCTSICGIYTSERDLSSSESRKREQGIAYVRACIDLASDVGASHVIVVPSPVGKLAPESTREAEWGYAAASLREAGAYASQRGVRIAVEALNRYETHLINKLDEATRLVKEVGSPHVKLMADLFHMNIEERNICQSLKDSAEHLIHVHIADNTREAAGRGQTDWASVMRTLQALGYQGPVTMEFMPTASNPYDVSRFRPDEAALAADVRLALETIRHAVQDAAAQADTKR
ncbi:sugar phosphate isomerase/epimerase family protein [Paenibacillus allorhizosphaerae]|uniref:L-ribulose 3-epimerase n=1 Tax=Paenibacillus allorhizosphaerae TaxID=2849866 RepID=A0ABN7TES6_9BACL|nr:sugar phosphate isomerase/epimerase family protein [Paenibacillus allorhizosphaerae]CAG7627768.1 L-ribulose 3-epimerase [Paenibacillus allorhizosphaerae]